MIPGGIRVGCGAPATRPTGPMSRLWSRSRQLGDRGLILPANFENRARGSGRDASPEVEGVTGTLRAAMELTQNRPFCVSPLPNAMSSIRCVARRGPALLLARCLGRTVKPTSTSARPAMPCGAPTARRSSSIGSIRIWMFFVSSGGARRHAETWVLRTRSATWQLVAKASHAISAIDLCCRIWVNTMMRIRAGKCRTRQTGQVLSLREWACGTIRADVQRLTEQYGRFRLSGVSWDERNHPLSRVRRIHHRNVRRAAAREVLIARRHVKGEPKIFRRRSIPPRTCNR